jgi:hypothetical protein
VQTSETARERNLREVAERFPRETANHQMTVLHDDGLYRHVRFRSPDNGFYWFDLVTWPGHLAFTGDMTGYTFARERDMFGFFRMGRGINPQYWAEKLVTDRDSVKRWSEDACREHIADAVRDLGGEHPGLWRDVKDQILDDIGAELSFADTALPLLRDYTYTYTTRLDPVGPKQPVTVAPFENAWEWNLTDYDWSFLWACHAIAWGIAQYDAAKSAEAKAAEPAVAAATP